MLEPPDALELLASSAEIPAPPKAAPTSIERSDEFTFGAGAGPLLDVTEPINACWSCAIFVFALETVAMRFARMAVNASPSVPLMESKIALSDWLN